MKINFSKYQGTGNDFILLDNRDGRYSALTASTVEFLCRRYFGIGADGLILLEKCQGYDFNMKYFNSDGKVSSMCGNGGRCITAFANSLHQINDEARFKAIDGGHRSLIISTDPMIVKLKMVDVAGFEMIGDDVFLNTGSPHYVKFVDDVLEYDVLWEGQAIRNNDRFLREGTNVNFVETLSTGLYVRTYERGVEEETLSCGTGVTASVLAAVIMGMIDGNAGVCEVKTVGGILNVYFEKAGGGFKNVWLEGEAKFVYSGEIEI